MSRAGKKLQGMNTGPRGGSLPAAFAIRARALLERAKGLEFAARVIQGKETEERATAKGGVVELKPAIADRLNAVKLLAETGRVLKHESETPLPNRQVVPVKEILAAVGTATVKALLEKSPERFARVKMLEAIDAEAEIMS